MWLREWDFTKAVAELAKYLGIAPATAARTNGKSKIVATYNYVDEQGKLLYQVVRFEPKDFRQRRPKGSGWEYSVKGTRLVPYRLPDLVAAPLSRGVLVVEGEKDVDRAAGIGIIATTCAMGAGKWRPEYNEHFRSRSVYVIPDNDSRGREHAQQVAQSASRHRQGHQGGGTAGRARERRLVGLAGPGPHESRVGWTGQGGS